ncbi:MAG: hypothetical protein QOJ02_2367 [Acidobacteriota bacterium]|jgi:CHAT domain-containing protein/tetratricopeptide (TPR) repeat protein|nr:hypothetical protein [Acidobacteriota bacterium]
MNIYLYIIYKLSRKLRFNFLTCIALTAFISPILAQENQPDERQLIVGEKIDRKVVGQEIHGYVVELKRGQVLRVTLQEKGADVGLFGARVADQKLVTPVANSGSGFMQESLTLIADQDGIYELIIRVQQITDSNAEAKYELTTTLSNTASPNDVQRVQAENLIADVKQILVNKDEEKFSPAISKLGEALKIWKALGDSYWEAVTKSTIGDVYIFMKNFGQAETNYIEALNLFDKVRNKGEVGLVYADLATIYFFTKNEEKTKLYVTQALQVSRSLGDARLEKTINNLTVGSLNEVEDIKGNKGLADFNKELSSKLATARAKKDRAAEAAVWASIVFRYGLDNDGLGNRPLFERAEREALPLVRAIKDKDSELKILLGLGFGYSDMNASTTNKEEESFFANKAKDYFIQALALSKILNNQIFEILAYAGLSATYDGDNDKLSIFLGKKFIDSIQNYRQTLKTVVDKENQQLIAKEFEDAYSEIVSDLTSEGRLQEALQVINFSRDQEFFDFKLIDNQPAGKLILTSREAENEPIFDDLVNKVISKYSIRPDANYQLAANELKDVFSKLESNFDVESSERDIAKNVPDAIEMQSALRQLSVKTGKKHVALYYSGEEGEGSEIILVTPEKIKLFTGGSGNVFGSNSKLSDAIVTDFLEVLSKLCADKESGKEIPCYDPRPLGGEIYRRIFKTQEFADGKLNDATLEAELENYKADVIHWSLTGKMRYIPVAALYDENTNQYLVEKFENVVFTRAKKERFLSEPKLWRQGLGLGTSVGYTIGDLVSSPLPWVPQEVFNIFGNKETQQEGLFSGRILLNKEFTRQSLLEIPKTKPDFVHIASHFRFQPGDAKKSFLLLGDGSTFSLLEMGQYLNLFEGVDLLTLSACQTAATKSDEATGKEVDGLAELAQRLGAKSVIATLWEIDDKGTSKIMAEFYRIRKENPDFSTSEDLRLAQLSLLNGKSSWVEAQARRRSFGKVTVDKTKNRISYKPSSESQFDHPYYWAPFVFYGSSNGEKNSDYIKSKPQPKPQNNDLIGSNPNSGGSEVFRSSNLIGNWEGVFDQQQYYCTLDIQNVEGNTFRGVLHPQGASIEVSGSIDLETKQISFIETKIISLGNNKGWILGSNKGSLSSDGTSISGTGFAGTVSYQWSFRKSSSTSSSSYGSNNFGSSVTLSEIESSFKSNLYDQTISLATRFLNTSPDSKEANAYLGLSYFIKKDVANALPYLEKAIRLGQPIPIPVKRLREPILGHGLDDVIIVFSNTEFGIISGQTIYKARYSDLTELAILNYQNQCTISHLKGTFIEAKTNSEGKINSDKLKQDKKTFNLFPSSAFLQPRQQGQMVLNFAACSNVENYVSDAIVSLMNRFSSRPN